jgi:hypothetical protein
VNTAPAGRRSLVRLALGIAVTGAVLMAAGFRPTVARAAAPTTVPATARSKATVKPAAPPTTAPAVAPIPAGTAPASTLPLQTREPSAHVSAIFPVLSAAGFILVVLMLALQWYLTKPGRQGWTL